MIQKRYLLLLFSVLCAGIAILIYSIVSKEEKSIPVGILHSLTGPLARYEKPFVDATILAIEEINSQGGILGKKLHPIIKDGKSESSYFVEGARNLIIQEKVAVLFGCWSSQDRKAVKPIVEQYNSLLFYPVQHEGLEDSPNIVYTNTIPNQQAIPAATWCLQNLGNKFFLVGSDELFPRATNEILKDAITLFNGSTVGEEYITVDGTNIDFIIEKITKSQPQVIINTIIGPTNQIFFKNLREAGITSEKIPTMSLCIEEAELQTFDAKHMIGDYSCWSHFKNTERPENRIFVEKIKNRYGQDYAVSDAMEAAYIGVYLWKQAITKAQTINTTDVQIALKNQSFDAPEGIIHIDDTTLHTWSVMSVGKIRSDKQFTVLWNSQQALRPMVYPFFKSRDVWNALLDEWYKQWGNKWSST